MADRVRKRKAKERDLSLRDGFAGLSAALSMGALWFLYRILEVRSPLLLGAMTIVGGLVLAAMLGGAVLLLRRVKARPASVAATVNILGGVILVCVYLVAAGWARQDWSYGDLLAFGIFLILIGLLILVFGRFRLLERLPL